VLEADKLGLYSEVVSRAEVDIALNLGIDPRKIIFNGPIKNAEDIYFSFQLGITLNVDSFKNLDT